MVSNTAVAIVSTLVIIMVLVAIYKNFIMKRNGTERTMVRQAQKYFELGD